MFKFHRHHPGTALKSILAGLLLCSPVWAQNATVTTEQGVYQGRASTHQPGVRAFEGIPFAAPPTGDLRWKPPQPPASFSGVRQADSVGPACWQARNSYDSLYARGQLDRSEDCLRLNIYTASETQGAELPVMVWFHGGSNTAGHGGASIFEGSNLASRGAVVVTANYRLGALGFFAHPALTEESPRNASGNYGLLDQIAVLSWVQQNIASFGGDPDRVTIFGQSAGGTDVCLLMASPLTEGMVHGVIGQSPGCIKLDTDLASGHERGQRFAASLGIQGSSANAVRQLREVDPETLVTTRGGAGGPVIDGWVLPDSPYALYQEGEQNRIPVIVGGLSDEYYGLQHTAAPITEEQLDQYLEATFGDRAAQVKSMYAAELDRSPLDARKTVMGDNGFLLSARLWARLVRERGDNAWVYYFSRPAPVFRLYVHEDPDLFGDGGQRGFGAYHSGELAYVFNNLDQVGIGWDRNDEMLSDRVADYWVNFARTGNPNGDGLPRWQTYDPGQDNVQVLDADVSNVEHPRRRQLDLLESLYLQGRD